VRHTHAQEGLEVQEPSATLGLFFFRGPFALVVAAVISVVPDAPGRQETEEAARATHGTSNTCKVCWRRRQILLVRDRAARGPFHTVLLAAAWCWLTPPATAAENKLSTPGTKGYTSLANQKASRVRVLARSDERCPGAAFLPLSQLKPHCHHLCSSLTRRRMVLIGSMMSSCSQMAGTRSCRRTPPDERTWSAAARDNKGWLGSPAELQPPSPLPQKHRSDGPIPRVHVVISQASRRGRWRRRAWLCATADQEKTSGRHLVSWLLLGGCGMCHLMTAGHAHILFVSWRSFCVPTGLSPACDL